MDHNRHERQPSSDWVSICARRRCVSPSSYVRHAPETARYSSGSSRGVRSIGRYAFSGNGCTPKSAVNNDRKRAPLLDFCGLPPCPYVLLLVCKFFIFIVLYLCLLYWIYCNSVITFCGYHLIRYNLDWPSTKGKYGDNVCVLDYWNF